MRVCLQSPRYARWHFLSGEGYLQLSPSGWLSAGGSYGSRWSLTAVGLLQFHQRPLSSEAARCCWARSTTQTSSSCLWAPSILSWWVIDDELKRSVKRLQPRSTDSTKLMSELPSCWPAPWAGSSNVSNDTQLTATTVGSKNAMILKNRERRNVSAPSISTWNNHGLRVPAKLDPFPGRAFSASRAALGTSNLRRLFRVINIRKKRNQRNGELPQVAGAFVVSTPSPKLTISVYLCMRMTRLSSCASQALRFQYQLQLEALMWVSTIRLWVSSRRSTFSRILLLVRSSPGAGAGLIVQSLRS